MPTPEFVTELRAFVGHRPLWLSVAVAVVLDTAADTVLLQRRADTGAWCLPGGILDPAEHPADAAVRECFEETGVVAVPEVLTSVTVSPPFAYPNGDRVQYLELAFRLRPIGGEARVNDTESLEVAWFPLDALPTLDASNEEWLRSALKGDGQVAYTFSGLERVLGDVPPPE